MVWLGDLDEEDRVGRRLSGIENAKLMGTRHMSAVETSLREEVVTTVNTQRGVRPRLRVPGRGYTDVTTRRTRRGLASKLTGYRVSRRSRSSLGTTYIPTDVLARCR